MISLSELTADYYRLRAEAERALALSACDPAEKERLLSTAAELEALCLEVLASDPDGAPSSPIEPLKPDANILPATRAA